MQRKAVVFDLDGTLVHTPKSYIYRVVGEVLRNLGMKSAPNEDIERFWFGMDRDKVITNIFHKNPADFWREFILRDTIQSRIQVARAYHDIGFLDQLKEDGYLLGIVTGAPLEMCRAEIGLIGGDKFDEVVIANPLRGVKPKPHPYGLEECLSQLDVAKEHAHYVGNAEEDFRTADQAGVLPVLVDRGEFDYGLVFSSGVELPKNIIRGLYDLGKILKK